MDGKGLLGQEWQTLQHDHERYEHSALLLKLGCLALCGGGLAAGIGGGWIGVALLVCWLQEGIVKTYQARLAARLLSVEALLRQADPQAAQAMQLYSEWSAQRPRGPALLAGYVASTCRPTVAFPYAPLLLALIVGRALAWY